MRKGWFQIPGVQDGDRTIEQQLLGLRPALDEAPGKTVLDLGCAEGLIARQFAMAGASYVFGVDSVAASIAEAGRQLNGFPSEVLLHDLNQAMSWPIAPNAKPWDMVLMLAILHKLRIPGKTLADAVRHEPTLLVLRLPPANAPTIIDARSGSVPLNVQDYLEATGYRLERVERGHEDEWTGYFRRA